MVQTSSSRPGRCGVARAGLAAFLLVLAACDGGSGGDGDGDGDGDGGDAGEECKPDNYLDWEGVRYSGAVGGEESLLPCDPQVGVLAYYEGESIIGETLESVIVSVAWGTLPPANNTYRAVALRVSGPGTNLEEGVAYPMTEDQSISFFEALDAAPDDTPRLCKAESGEAVVTELGGDGEFVRGSYSVTAWADNADGCPALPVSGEFQVLREN